LARDLARRSAAHAVTDGENSTFGPDGLFPIALHQAAAPTRQVCDEKIILVVLADLPDIGSPEEGQANFACRRPSVLRSAHLLP
jgi:hypothetical protein